MINPIVTTSARRRGQRSESEPDDAVALRSPAHALHGREGGQHLMRGGAGPYGMPFGPFDMWSAMFKTSSGKGNAAVMDTAQPMRQVLLANATVKVEQLRAQLQIELQTLRMIMSKAQTPGGPAPDRKLIVRVTGLDGSRGGFEVSRLANVIHDLAKRIDNNPAEDPLASDEVQVQVAIMEELVHHMKSFVAGQLSRELVEGVASCYEASR